MRKRFRNLINMNSLSLVVFLSMLTLSFLTGCSTTGNGLDEIDNSAQSVESVLENTDVNAKKQEADTSLVDSSEAGEMSVTYSEDGRDNGGDLESESENSLADVQGEQAGAGGNEKESGAGILHFVDVFGEEYEVGINENIKKNPYVNEAFVRDGDRLSYDDGIYSSRVGIDVSKYQGSVDWRKVRESGIDFVFIRIGFRGYGTEGVICIDSEFKNNMENARAQGIDVGVYFFSQAINEDEAIEEAEFVLDNLKGHELQMPIVYDPESILDAEARTDDVTGEQFTKNALAFCKRISDAGYQPMIYCNMLWEAYELDLEALSEYPIWYADYEPLPQTPYMFEIWQYTNEARIPGISGLIDMNIQLMEDNG